jgi:hypothetical protein
MKVFFVGSPRALTHNKSEFEKIYHTITELGHENIFDLMITLDPREFYDRTKDKIRDHYKNTLKCLQVADVIIIESSIHSLTMGYLARMGEELDKPVIILHKPGKEPFFFSGNLDDRFLVVEYTMDTIKDVLKSCFDYAKDVMDIRFNLFLSPQMNSYLKQVSKLEHTTCSNFMRNLLKEHMDKHPEFFPDGK